MNERAMYCHLPDETATCALAQALAACQPGAAMVHLEGDLGAGKSTFARAFLRALGVTGAIPSPTYTLVERYPTRHGAALHLDLYRIADAGELEFLGLDELAPWLWLVEWPERAGACLPPADLHLQLQMDGEGRALALVGKSPPGRLWLERLRSHSPFVLTT